MSHNGPVALALAPLKRCTNSTSSCDVVGNVQILQFIADKMDDLIGIARRAVYI